MSIAAVSSAFVAATREKTPLAPVTEAASSRRFENHRHGGRRHELVDAMKAQLGVTEGGDRAGGKTVDQAVFRFAHALMRDLRQVDGAGDAGRGVGLGKRTWSDLSQRLGTLATAAAAPAATATAAAPAATAVASAAAEPEVPQAPNPVTVTTAAVHLMRVPTSHLLEAFAALHEALGQQSDGADPRAELSAFLDRMSQSLASSGEPTLPAGSVMHLTA